MSTVRPPDRDTEVRIAKVLEAHGPREGEALAAYQELVEDYDDRGIRYLASMILEDERRHHRIITEMLNEIRAYIWEVDIEPRTPYLSERIDPELRAATDRLLKFEKDDARELRALRRELRGQPASSMLPLLVDLMIHDTAKHIALLKAIRDRTRAR